MSKSDQWSTNPFYCIPRTSWWCPHAQHPTHIVCLRTSATFEILTDYYTIILYVCLKLYSYKSLKRHRGILSFAPLWSMSVVDGFAMHAETCQTHTCTYDHTYVCMYVCTHPPTHACMHKHPKYTTYTYYTPFFFIIGVISGDTVPVSGALSSVVVVFIALSSPVLTG